MDKLFTRSFEWRFDHAPEKIWQALADTSRFNEAAGLPKHDVEERRQPDGTVRFFAEAKMGPFKLAWEEIPVEWVEPRWFRHLRVFSKGPLKTLCATLRLASDGAGGAVGHYTIDATPANAIGAFILSTGFFPSAERNFGILAQSIREWAAGRRELPYPVNVKEVSAVRRTGIEHMVGRIEATPYGHRLAARLAAWISRAQEVDVMQMRPLTLARRWHVPDRTVIELFLQSVKEGLLESRWTLLCPRCRAAKFSALSLDEVPRGAHCNTCNINYERDFARNVELSFRPGAAVRPVSDGEFCIFGPMTTPHVKVQVTLNAGQTAALPATFRPGRYRLRTLEIGGESDIAYAGEGFPSVIAVNGTVTAGPSARDGEVQLVNEEDRRRTVIVESREWVGDALTAERVTAMQAFRDLFSDAVLRPGDEVAISRIALLFTDLKGSTAFYQKVGDAVAYHTVREHYAFLSRVVHEHDGGVVKTIGDSMMAAFPDPVDAVRAALAVQRGIDAFNAEHDADGLVVRVGVHAGPCIAVTLNGRLDYFGSTVNLAARLEAESAGGDIVLSDAVASDPRVAPLLAPFAPRKERRGIRGFREPITFLRLTAKVAALVE